MDRLLLTEDQEAEAQRIARIVLEASKSEVMAMARLLASKPDRQLLGPTIVIFIIVSFSARIFKRQLTRILASSARPSVL